MSRRHPDYRIIATSLLRGARDDSWQGNRPGGGVGRPFPWEFIQRGGNSPVTDPSQADRIQFHGREASIKTESR